MLAVGFAANAMDKHKLEISGVQAGFRDSGVGV